MGGKKPNPREDYRGLFEKMVEILFLHDPIGLNFGDNPDEYEPEVESILGRLEGVNSELKVRQIIHEEFIRWFSEDLAGPEEKYDAIAAEFWALWLRHKGLVQ